MPRYALYCINCEETSNVIRPDVKSLVSARCRRCGSSLERYEIPPTSRIIETLDNGLMTRAVERPADTERLYKEKAEADRKGK